MNLLLLTFGDRVENHHQAVFCALSFLKDPRIGRVLVMTDRPHFYRWLQAGSTVPVETIVLSPETLAEWQGPHQFFWRIKIRAVEEALKRHPDQHLLYVDSDTLLATDLVALDARLSAGTAFMHCLENRLADRNSRTLTRMRDTLMGQTLEGVAITGESTMWNAGVIAVPGQGSRLPGEESAADVTAMASTTGSSSGTDRIALALRLCDAMCDTPCPRRLVEQFAFSLALQQGSIEPCHRDIVHYWGNKAGWNAFINSFLAGCRLRDDSVADAITQAAALDWKHLPVENWPRSSAERIKRSVDWLLPRRRVRYFNPG